MSKEGKRELNRRDFVATSAAALVGVTCLGAGTKEALARARATGKTLFTAENLNRLFDEHWRAGRIKSVARDIANDIPGWIIREFTLTEVQEKRVRSISGAGWADVRRVLAEVEAHGGTLRVEISDPNNVFKHHAARPVFCRAKVESTTTKPDGTTTTTKGSVSAGDA
jgi:hypothetical protein